MSGTAVVTGGSGGIGRAIVREFTARGWDVAVLARGRDAIDATVAEAVANGRRAIGIPVDVSDGAAVEAAAARVEAELGPIDVWVNNAIVGAYVPFTELPEEDFEHIVQVDFFGYVHGTRAALARMRPRDRGTIVQVGSALGHRGIPLQSAYCASKHAIVGFCESLVTELLHEGSHVTVSEVDMPGMNTTQFSWTRSSLPKPAQPVPPILQPEICAKVVVDVALKPRRRTWVGEPTVFTILGNRVGSRFADAYLARFGVKGQQADDVPRSDLPENLWEPVPGDHGAHGPFDARAWSITPQTWAIRHRPVVVSGALAALGAGVAAAVALLPRAVRPAVAAAAVPVAKAALRR